MKCTLQCLAHWHQVTNGNVALSNQCGEFLFMVLNGQHVEPPISTQMQLPDKQSGTRGHSHLWTMQGALLLNVHDDKTFKISSKYSLPRSSKLLPVEDDKVTASLWSDGSTSTSSVFERLSLSKITY